MEGNTGFSSNPHLHVEFGQQYDIVAYPDLRDGDRDGDRSEWIYAAHVYAEHNIAFSGYTRDEVAGWPWGHLEQANHSGPLPLNWNFVRNGRFDSDLDWWRASGQLNWFVQDGALHLTRIATDAAPLWARAYQDLFYGTPANAPFEVTLRIGNASPFRKTVTVGLQNASGRQYGIVECSFMIEPNTPPRAYTMQARTTSTWGTLRLQIGVNPPDGAPAALIDDVAVHYRPNLPITAPVCAGPM
ncbi:MAG: hypothetical protein GYB67_07525 [Chloroflexi bacterium]|nr:hypothetical protein [Chloroflexota bacterium]